VAAAGPHSGRSVIAVRMQLIEMDSFTELLCMSATCRDRPKFVFVFGAENDYF